ncbi:MAG: beta-lactamase family protein [Bacteroidetes bacterium]|nr:beta-lactamase family protein [Bacteroidota bacterium]
MLIILLLLTVNHTFGQIDTIILNQIIGKNISENNFEGTVLISEKGNAIFQKSAGFSNHESKILINDETKYGIASITKMLTAIVILQLTEENRMSLKDNLNKLLPGLEIPNGEIITVHHLLLHISGLPNENDSIYLDHVSPEEFVKKTISGNTDKREFGKFNYANIDYVLLGLIIEKITGIKWEEAVNERILNRLGLKNTGFLKKGKYPENFAFSYSVSDKGEFIKDPEIHLENFFSAGCMYSNAEDILTIDQAMYGSSLLSENSKALMYTSYPEYNYTGYSVWTYNYPFAETKPKIMERRGGIMGWNCVLVRMLDANRSIIILSSNNRFNPDSFGDKENMREALITELGKAEKK